jgi:hypothetical protein
VRLWAIEVHVASIFRVQVYRIVSFCVNIVLCFFKRTGMGHRVGIVASSGPVGTVNLCSRPFYGPRNASESHDNGHSRAVTHPPVQQPKLRYVCMYVRGGP